MIGTNIHENPQPWSGDVALIATVLASTPATSVNSKVTSTPIVV